MTTRVIIYSSGSLSMRMSSSGNLALMFMKKRRSSYKGSLRMILRRGPSVRWREILTTEDQRSWIRRFVLALRYRVD